MINTTLNTYRSIILKRLTQALAVLLASLLSLSALAVNLKSEVDRTSININESLRLIVSTDSANAGTVDFSQLESQFDIVNQQQSNRQQITNGRITASTQWIFILLPKDIGNLLIPSFQYKGVYSNPIEIRVTEETIASTSSQGKDVFLEVEVDQESLYVQEQLLVKTRLYYKVSLSSYDAPDFTLKDATVELLADQTYKKNVNNQTYQVLELTYSIHPQASGKLIIPEQRWRLEKPTRGFLDNTPSPYLFTKSQAIEITVKPIPTNSTAVHWLPSPAVTLTPTWEQSPLQAKAGEPLNLKLNLSANGLLASQLPEIILPTSENFAVFTDKSISDTIKSAQGIIGSRTSQFAIIPETPGTWSLPAITLKWWNTKINQEQTITLAEQTIIVAASALQKDSLPTLPTLSTPANTSSNDAIGNTNSGIWQAISFTLLIACACLLYWVYRLRQNRMIVTTNISMVNPESANRKSQKQLINAIKQCVKRNQKDRLRPLLIEWAQDFCNSKSITSLADIGQQIPELELPLQQMNNALYGARPDDSWHPEALITVIENLKKVPRSQKGEALAPLY